MSIPNGEKNRDYCQRFEDPFLTLSPCASFNPAKAKAVAVESKLIRARVEECWENIRLMTPCKSNMPSLETPIRDIYSHIATIVALIVVTRHDTMLWIEPFGYIRICPRAGNPNRIENHLHSIVREALRVWLKYHHPLNKCHFIQCIQWKLRKT